MLRHPIPNLLSDRDGPRHLLRIIGAGGALSACLIDVLPDRTSMLFREREAKTGTILLRVGVRAEGGLGPRERQHGRMEEDGKGQKRVVGHPESSGK